MNTGTLGYFRNSKLMEKLVLKKSFWILLLAFFFSYPLIKSFNRQLPPELPVYSVVPNFNFLNEDKKEFGSKDLLGKVYIANFMFTSCKTECPILLKKVQKVQHRLRGVIDRAAIISFSVDPETDNSETLYKKARELNANPNVWRFLTGSKEEMKNLLVNGFKVPMGDKEFAKTLYQVAHSNKFALVDKKGNIRGYYDSDELGINKLMIDIGLLINRN